MPLLGGVPPSPDRKGDQSNRTAGELIPRRGDATHSPWEWALEGGTAIDTVIAPTRVVRRVSAAGALALFAGTIFLAAVLGFLVQPMVAKMVLPLFGGSPATWTTAMVFFQAVLLAAYGFAHASTRVLGAARQPVVQLVLLGASLATLPIGRNLAPPASEVPPAVWLLGVLAVTVGAPFFIVACTSPLLQRWVSSTEHPAARDPYFLYVASNAGSLVGLLSYPLLVEPRLSLDAQASLWTGLYVVYGLLIVGCWAYVARTRTAATEIAGRERSRVGARTRARWVLMAFVPSSLMLGATTFISADIAATPLLWVLPLSVYLLTFVLAFSRRPLLTVARASSALPFLAVLVALSLLGLVAVPTWGLVLLHLATLAVAGMLAHRRLFSERPPTDRMTEFYLLLSLGGVLGGVFNALVAPAVFDSVVEYPLVIVLALLLRPRPAAVRGGRPAIWALQDAIPPLLAVAAFAVTLGGVESERGRLIAASAVGLALLAFRRRPLRFAIGVAGLLALAVFSSSGGIYSDRTFFGVLRVIEDGDRRILVHGTTVHGEQRTGGSRRMEPLSYFARSGPAGDLFPDRRDRRDVDVVGLGVGSLAAYGQPGDTFTFYEIDPGVVRIASDAQLFTFLRDSPAATRVVIGDGRLSLAKAPSARIDLLVVDAFSSDAIPAHLLTREAFDLYFRRLRPDGLLALHISNRHLRLAPVIAALARDRGLAAAERYDEVGPEAHATTRLSSHWVVLARTHRQLERLLALNWRPLEPGTSRVWTDDFSNVLSVLNWH